MMQWQLRAWARLVVQVSLLVLLPSLLSACSPANSPLLLFERPFAGEPVDLQKVLGGNEFLLKDPASGKRFIMEISVNPGSKRTRIYFGSDQQRIRDEVFRGRVLRLGELLLLQRPAADEPSLSELGQSRDWVSVRVLRATGNHLLGLQELANQPRQLTRYLDSTRSGPAENAGMAEQRELAGQPVWLAKPDSAVWTKSFSRFLAMKTPLAIVGRRQTSPQTGSDEAPAEEPAEEASEQRRKPAQPNQTDTALSAKRRQHGQTNPYAPPSDDAERKRGVYLYPNPTPDTLHLEVVDIGAYQWEILNANGKLLRQANGHRPRLHLNLQNWEPGTYFLRFFAREEPYAETFSFRIDPNASDAAPPSADGLEGKRVTPED